MLGKPALLKMHQHLFRITSARAGKTQQAASLLTGPADHPRVCGENFLRTSHSSVYIGSPPRVRGKPDAGTALARRARITPACAGKTLSVCHPIRASSDHPRVCGEN